MTVFLASAPNLRDLGGRTVLDGRHVRRGLVYRSAALNDPAETDREALRALGIRLVCDLRGGSERIHAPNLFWERESVRRVDLDILADIRGDRQPWGVLRDDPTAAGGRALMRAIYRVLPEAAARHIVTIMEHVAAGDLPLLIHCSAGKDRTGFVSAILLDLLGVAREDVVADYLASADRLDAAAVVAAELLVREHAPEADAGALASIVGVDASYLEESFAAIAAAHCSIRAYLAEAGAGDELIEAVQAQLLA